MFCISVRFRAIPINTELKAFQGPVDVYFLDPNRHIMRRWLSRQVSFTTSKIGTIKTKNVLKLLDPSGNNCFLVLKTS